MHGSLYGRAARRGHDELAHSLVRSQLHHRQEQLAALSGAGEGRGDGVRYDDSDGQLEDSPLGGVLLVKPSHELHVQALRQAGGVHHHREGLAALVQTQHLRRAHPRRRRLQADARLVGVLHLGRVLLPELRHHLHRVRGGGGELRGLAQVHAAFEARVSEDGHLQRDVYALVCRVLAQVLPGRLHLYESVVLSQHVHVGLEGCAVLYGRLVASGALDAVCLLGRALQQGHAPAGVRRAHGRAVHQLLPVQGPVGHAGYGAAWRHDADAHVPVSGGAHAGPGEVGGRGLLQHAVGGFHQAGGDHSPH
mmetsp:Transcript_7319/g.16018  ORF Transcript_7319/g.16018 Transcript_7319/m.16018 type:complete len:307 (-) Transcript_7319:1239-2159(-)